MTYRAKSCKKSKRYKMRGYVSHGQGRIGKHRKHESGRGNAGGQHHHRIMMDKYHPGYFGKVGMRHFHWKKNPRYQPTVQLANLLSMVDKEDLKSTRGTEKCPVVDLVSKGYFKLLGMGKLNRGLIVKARSFSQLAEKKIKAAGGACVLI
eukprot:NODE_3926_length_621_cov_4718.998252_g2827_i1.p1 GENE.NODE_3926_length_621_cov_4718.998252_g2827_i1~~NODE_3926_length_621_cov_4718.998252_g2827_i1.p1  ORF type:complete len:150 (+),score=25.44 NODE_3926_length_621_cov_4718.998252_g2827_i1:65-514(+)